MTPDGCMVRSVVQHSVVAKCPFPCWVGTDGAGCDRAPACSRSGCGCGCQSPWPSIDPLDGSRRTHAQQGQRILGLRFSEPGSIHEDDGLRTYLFGQCRCRGGGLYTTPFLRLAGTGSLGLGLHEHRSTTWYQRCSGKYHYARAVLYPVALLQVVVGTRTMEVRVAIFETLPMDALLGADVPEFPSCCIQTLVLMLWLSWHELRGARYSLRRWALVRRSRSQELPALVWTKSMSGWPATMMISFAKDGPEADNPEFRSMQNDMPMQRTWHKMRTRLWLMYGQKRPRTFLTSMLSNWEPCSQLTSPWRQSDEQQMDNLAQKELDFSEGMSCCIAFGPRLDVTRRWSQNSWYSQCNVARQFSRSPTISHYQVI